ncbi:uncharacterized protein BDZ99DRAFT_501463 [Mytilinidion resinicola]|uniref:F-box domain-containing protein n=1 Tax=Mytilinidion resinicola TaxID=574789 RepID=A0A6A6YB82_9PEZI|nr:uncharacterized protein BDZ99DRAFT_501463 [Mytilinidion resinicola]KAF2805879.1 hypothetical protein BDZ99DRAFT_501463 [Mytilinidion resinicola]
MEFPRAPPHLQMPEPSHEANIIVRHALQVFWSAAYTALRQLLAKLFYREESTEVRDAVLNSPELFDLILCQIGTPQVLQYKRICKEWNNAIETSPTVQHDLWKRRIRYRESLTEFTTHDSQPSDLRNGVCRICGVWANHQIPSPNNLNAILTRPEVRQRRPWVVRRARRYVGAVERSNVCWSLQDDGSLLLSFLGRLPLPTLAGDLDLTTASWRDTVVSLPEVTKVTMRGRRDLDVWWLPTAPFIIRWDTEAVLETPDGLRMGDLVDAMCEMREFTQLRLGCFSWRRVHHYLALMGALLLVWAVTSHVWLWILCSVARGVMPWSWVKTWVPGVLLNCSTLARFLWASLWCWGGISAGMIFNNINSRDGIAQLQKKSKAKLTWL